MCRFLLRPVGRSKEKDGHFCMGCSGSVHDYAVMETYLDALSDFECRQHLVLLLQYIDAACSFSVTMLVILDNPHSNVYTDLAS